MTEQPVAQVSNDFVFGTLSTDALRIAQLRAARAGVSHGQRLTPADPRPGEAVAVHISVGPGVVADAVSCYYTTDGSDPAGEQGVASVGQSLALVSAGVEWDTLLWGYVRQWVATIPPQPAGTQVRYRLEAWSAGGPSRWASEIAGVVAGDPPAQVDPLDVEMFALPGGQPLWPVRRSGSYGYHVDDERVPTWLRDAVIYHIFVDRFATTGGRPFNTVSSLGDIFGGTLRGVIEHLDYLSALNVTCLWLSPIFPSDSHHGYDPYDYRSIEPRLGTLADFQELVAAAYARGMRVLLDYVVNHVSNDHPAFQRAVADRNAPEASWFTFTSWPDQYLSFFGVPTMPQINADDPAARDYMIDCARYWLDLGVDGLRLDYANGPSHAFWSAFRAATRATRPDSVTLGEVVETPALQQSYAGRMDGCLDFVLLQGLRDLFAFGTSSPATFDAFVRRHLEFFPQDFVLPSFLDNHDMNRFLWVVQGDTRRLKLAALCQFTLPNPPIIYYGTEVGLSQERDVRYADGSGHAEESRAPMPWGAAQDTDLLAFYQVLVALRRAAPEVWRGERSTLRADHEAGAYVYRCAAGEQAAVVALNSSSAPVAVTLPPERSYWIGLASGAAALQGNKLLLEPLGGAVLWERER